MEIYKKNKIYCVNKIYKKLRNKNKKKKNKYLILKKV